MIKIAMIGAGSVVFSKNLTGDILSFPEFRNATIAYMDIDKDRLEVGASLCRRLAKSIGAKPKIEATLDRRKALAGADFVINMVQIGGFNSTLVDFEIPRKYGLNFTIADTTGPGGFFRALRTYPMLKGLCADMMELCPSATLLNYSNPMSMNMQTVFRTSNVRAVGLCHSVQGTHSQLMGYINEKPQDTNFVCAGINHMAFFLSLRKNGEDLYPRLFEAMNDPHVFNSNKVRFELMKRLGYFVTESSEHNAEYCAYFIPHGKEQIAKFAVPLDEYLRRCDTIVDEFDRLKKLSRSKTADKPLEVHRSHEYGSNIIHSIVSGQPRVVYGNLPNRGCIDNLPATAIAEAPTLVDRNGLALAKVGELPPQCAAYMMPHVMQHELFIRAAMEGRRDHVYHAAMNDPLTAATMPPDKIVEMCDELIAAHGFEKSGGCLPALDAKKTLVPTSGKNFSTVDPRDLRKSWDDAQAASGEEAIKEWQLIGPFPGKKKGQISLDEVTPVDKDFARSKEGEVDLSMRYEIGNQQLKWKKVTANKKGYVDLSGEVANQEWCIAYGYTEIEEVHGRETVLSLGSDDGIQVWLNGKSVFKLETGRGYSAGSDSCPIYLKPGINRILVKIDNYTYGWGFGLAVPKPSF